jgi:hypothetical protein
MNIEEKMMSNLNTRLFIYSPRSDVGNQRWTEVRCYSVAWTDGRFGHSFFPIDAGLLDDGRVTDLSCFGWIDVLLRWRPVMLSWTSIPERLSWKLKNELPYVETIAIVIHRVCLIFSGKKMRPKRLFWKVKRFPTGVEKLMFKHS